MAACYEAASELYRNICSGWTLQTRHDLSMGVSLGPPAIVPRSTVVKTEYDYNTKDGKENSLNPADALHSPNCVALYGTAGNQQPNLAHWNNITFRVDRSGKFNADLVRSQGRRLRLGTLWPTSALVNDVCAAALRAFFNASQRER